MNAPLNHARLVNPLTQYLQAYLGMGWAIQPLHCVADGVCTCRDRSCKLPGGHPLVAPTKNAIQLTSLYARSPAANFGVATGAVSGIFALAVDVRTGGRESLATLEESYGTLPDTLNAATALGDQHIVFKLPPGINLVRSLGKTYPGIEVKSDGDFIPVEPSVSDNRYSWKDWEAGEPINIALAPEWLLALASGRPALQPKHGQPEVAGPATDPSAAESKQPLSQRALSNSDVPPFGHIARRLHDCGFQPVPLIKGTKRPALKKWTDFVAGPESLERFDQCHTGLLTRHAPAADIDVRMPDTVARLRELARTMLGEGAVRIGMEPKVAILFRTDQPFSKLATPEYRHESDEPGSKPHRVEFLAEGQQLVAFATHEATGKPYRWLSKSPAERHHDLLPLVTAAKAREFIHAATQLMDIAPGFTRVHPETAVSAVADKEVARESVGHATLAELRSALGAIPSDDRELWQRMGHALRTLGQQGYALFTEWSQKSPKYDAADAERVWNSLHPSRTHWKAVFTEAQQRGWLNPSKRTGVPPGPAPLPAVESGAGAFELPEFPRECLHGIVGDVVELATLNTEAGVPAVAFATLALFGAAAGRNACIQIGDGTKHLRPWGIIIGPTSTGRKGTSLELPLKLLERAQDVVAASGAGNLIGTAPRLESMNGVATGEGLIFAIRDETTLMKGKKPAWLPVEDKRLLVIDEEFASTLAKCSRKDATLSAILRKAWDGRKLDNPTRSEPVEATRPHIVMLGQITPDEFLTKTETVDLMNGLINRSLLILTKRNRSVPIPTPAPANRVEDLATRLAQCLSFAWGGCAAFDVGAENGLSITLSPEARDLYERGYETLTRDRPGVAGGATGRMSTHVWIIAALYAVLDRSAVVCAEHMEAALGWARYGFDCAALLFNARENKRGLSEDAARAERVYSAIRAAGSAGITRTDLSAEFSGHFSAAKINAAIALLLEQRRISEESEPATGGRPAKRYRAT